MSVTELMSVSVSEEISKSEWVIQWVIEWVSQRVIEKVHTFLRLSQLLNERVSK